MNLESKDHLYNMKILQGPGLMLDYNQKGTFVAIACGTGGLMFVDMCVKGRVLITP